MTAEDREELNRQQWISILDDYGRDEVWLQVNRVTAAAGTDDFLHAVVVNEGGTSMPKADGSRRLEHISIRRPGIAERAEVGRRYRLWRDAAGPHLDI